MKTLDLADVWLTAGCLRCAYWANGPAGSVGGACPNDGSPLLLMDSLIWSDDVIEFARRLTRLGHAKAEHDAAAAAVATFRPRLVDR